MGEKLIEQLTRPIIGIENRTAQEAFDMMADRIRGIAESLSPPPEGVERLRELSKKATQGPWYTDTERSEGEYGRGPDTHSGYDAYLICAEGEGPYHGQQRVLFDSHNSTMTEVEEDQHADEFGAIDAWDAVAKANAEFIVACVDHVRQALNSFDKGGER